jgi:hypothetical protein
MDPVSAALSLMLVFASPAHENVDMMIADFASDEFEVREAASKTAEKLGAKHFLQFELAAAKSKDAEVIRRCMAVSDSMVRAEMQKFGKLPWITVQGVGWAETQELEDYRAKALKVFIDAGLEYGGTEYQENYLATEMYCEDRVRLHLTFGWSLQPIREDVEKMRANENRWRTMSGRLRRGD